ncbi:hypothetical protein JOB18_041116 [Solea senegalensis]|uniref:RIB43A domain with coiled-coils 2 n=1 Tax=Solea senegalensis TaxID=28829 RepID=A0AAV6T154_SOLSE|nr:hypothetical protein JOB18_041116 [Solea senegalensis]
MLWVNAVTCVFGHTVFHTVLCVCVCVCVCVISTFTADGHMIHNSRVAYMNQIREKEKQRVCQKAIDNFRHENQQFCDRLEFDLNDPDRLRKTKLEHGHVSLSGLLGEDLNYYDRLQRQKDQFKSWLIQQQNDKASVRHEQQLEDDQYDQFVLKMDNTALQIQRLEKQRRKAEAISTNEHNLVKTEEDKHRRALESAEAENQLQRQCATTSVGVPGLWPSTDKRPPPESRQKIMQFQKYQMEERKVTPKSCCLRAFTMAVHWNLITHHTCLFYLCFCRGPN